jgi:hypothetical protein
MQSVADIFTKSVAGFDRTEVATRLNHPDTQGTLWRLRTRSGLPCKGAQQKE